MGYTHYWTETKKPKQIPTQAIKIIKEIVDKAYTDGIVQYEDNVARPPVVNREEIRFNGVGEWGHETFHYGISDNYKTSENKYFAFCKTAQKPYDTVVMKVLIVLNNYLGDAFKLSSDGFNDKYSEPEWKRTVSQMRKEYGITFTLEGMND
jgi:hypothetical protein